MNLSPAWKHSLTKEEVLLFKRLKTPSHIQSYLESLPFNFEKKGETCRSPREVIIHKEAHCMEGALLAASMLWYHGKKPLLLDLKATRPDLDHVVTLFKENGRFGAISKTNHAVLRFRDPVYKSVRELALSYFHEYFLDGGKKTLRSFSQPFSLIPFGTEWITSSKNLWYLPRALDKSKHSPIATPATISGLRPASKIERRAGILVEYKPHGQAHKILLND